MNTNSITNVIEELAASTGINFFGVCIQLNNQKRYWATTHPELMREYCHKGYDRVDTMLDPSWLRIENVFKYSEHGRDKLQQEAIDYRKKHGINLQFGLVRHCEECHVLIICGTGHPGNPDVLINDATLTQVEKAAMIFINERMDKIVTELSVFKKSLFVKDEIYRNRVLANRSEAKLLKLFPSEVEVLYWAARGKTAEETSVLLDLSVNTMYSYRKAAIQKLQCSNITHAVYKAHILGLIS